MTRRKIWHVNIGRVFGSQLELSKLSKIILERNQVEFDGMVTVVYELLHTSSDLPKLYFRSRWTNGEETVNKGEDTHGYIYVLKNSPSEILTGNKLVHYRAIANGVLIKSKK